MKHLLLPVLLIACLIGSCKKEDSHPCTSTSDTEYFKFGYTGGFAGLHKFFVIKNGQLYPEDSTQPALSAAKYNMAKVLISNLPAYLSGNPNQSYLCQECADQITISIRRRVNGVEQYWNIDDVLSHIPAELKAYTIETRDVLDQL